MAQDGHCCQHAGDCTTGICISGACWPKADREEHADTHSVKALILLVLVASVLCLGCLVTCCCMRSLKMKIQVQAEMALQRKKSIRQSAGEGVGPTSRGCMGGSAANSGLGSDDRENFASHVDVHVAIDAEMNVRSSRKSASLVPLRNSLGSSVMTKHRTNKSDATTTLQGGIYGSDMSCA